VGITRWLWRAWRQEEEGRAGAGCLLEKTWNGSDPVQLTGGGQRTFLQDGDTIVLTGYCQGEGYRVGFGECRGTMLPARELSTAAAP
jgi:fumarylacetoacetase